MTNGIFKLPSTDTSLFGETGRKKRRNISFTEKAILWERNKSHICHICKTKIHSLTEAQLDHVKAHSKGGQRVQWAHSSCNRLKGNRSLSEIHKRLGISKPLKKKSSKKKRRSSSDIWINPITGRREKIKSPFGF